jgi:hypothetical protein
VFVFVLVVILVVVVRLNLLGGGHSCLRSLACGSKVTARKVYLKFWLHPTTLLVTLCLCRIGTVA